MSDRMLSDEILLGIINSKSGGGGGGTTNYNNLDNLPQIGGVTLRGNKTASDLGLATETALADKADKSAVKNEFIGTLEEWNALTIEQRKAYDTYQITDDFISGSGSGFAKDLLYSNETTTTLPSSVTLSKSWKEYDALAVCFESVYQNRLYVQSSIILKEYLEIALDTTYSNGGFIPLGNTENSAYLFGKVESETVISDIYGTVLRLGSIYGLKFGGGSGNEYSTSYLYNGEAEPKNFTMPSGTAMQPLFTGKYGMDFKGGAGDFIRVATSKTAIDFTDISTLKFSGLHYDGFNVMLGSFIESVDVSSITGLKYLSVGYRTTNSNNSAVYAITDTTTVTSNDVVALKTKTGATDVSMFTQIIAE